MLSELVLVGLYGIRFIDESHIPLSAECITVVRCFNLHKIAPLKARNWKKICIHSVPMLSRFPAIFSLADRNVVSSTSSAVVSYSHVPETIGGRSRPWYMASLSILECNSLHYISERINFCDNIQSVVIGRCQAVKAIGRSFWNNAHFSRVHLFGLPSLTLLSANGLFDTNLRSLVVQDCVSLVINLDSIAGLSLLEALTVKNTV